MSGSKIHFAADHPALKQTTEALTLNAAPMPWAKRLGGPGTNFCHALIRGPLTRTANCPRGEIVGPAITRARNPYVSGMRIHEALAKNATTDIATTPRATVRAAASFTGLGKEKNCFISISYQLSRKCLLVIQNEMNCCYATNNHNDCAHNVWRYFFNKESPNYPTNKCANEQH